MNEIDILVVEDEPELRDLICEVLRAENFSVVAAEDGMAAIEILAAGARPYVALCDISMPRLDGLQFIGEALKLEPSLGVILLTGHDDSDKIREALRLGAIDYLLKPFAHAELLERLYRSLSIARLRRTQVGESTAAGKAMRSEALLRIKNSKSRVA